MRPRGRGDDFEDDDDDEFEDVSPPRATPEQEPEPEPEPEADPAPAPSPPPQQPVRPALSSLVVRPPPQENGGSSPPPSAGRPARSPSPPDGGPRRGSPPPRRRREFSPPGPRGWERRRSPPPPERRRPVSPLPPRRRYSPPPPRFQPPRHPRFHDEPQVEIVSAAVPTCNGYGPSPPRPPRRVEASTFDDAVGPRYPRGYQGGGRGGRFREGSPPYGRGGRSYGRGYPGKDLININGEYVHRNDPNLSPREGDWICQNPNCGNLNFARRTHCNNCNKYRYAPEGYEPSRSPRRGYLSPPPRGPARIGAPPIERAPPPREMARYRSPPRGWGMDDPRGYASRSPPAARAGRFAEPPLKERMPFRGDHGPRDRSKFDWSATDNYSQRERLHDGMYLDSSRRRSMSPQGNWATDLRDRSRSPRNRPMKSSFTGRGPPDHYDDPYMSRGRPNNLEAGRGRGYRPGGGPYPGEGRGGRRPAARARIDDNY